MVRGRPSGLKAACGTAARRPWRAGPDPGDLCGPWRQEPRARHKPAPALRAAPRPPNPGIVTTETVIYRHRCNDPLNSRGQNWRYPPRMTRNDGNTRPGCGANLDEAPQTER